MRSINRMTIFATIAIALIAAPVGLTAQSRTGGSSRDSSSTSSSASRSTSSSSASRPASSSQVNRGSTTSSSQVSRSSGSQVSRSGSSAAQSSRNSGSQVNRGTATTTQSSRNSGSQVNRSSSTQSSRTTTTTQPSRTTSSQVNRGSATTTQPSRTSGSQVNRSSSTQSSRTTTTTQPSRTTSSQVNRGTATTTQGTRAAGSTRQSAGASSNLNNRNTTAVPTKGLDAVPRNQAASETAGIKARPDETSTPDRTGTTVSRTGGATSAAGQGTDRTGTAVSRTGGATSRAAQAPRPQAGSMLPDNYRGANLPRGEVRMDRDRNIHRIPPREREFMPYDRPVSFYRNAYHFYGCRVVSLPAAIVRSVIWGIDYYMWNNIYYRRYGDVYYISRPPFGVVFSPLDYELELVACCFNYFNNAYWTYRTINENAATIAEQNRIIAQNNATIAAQNASMALNTDKARKAYTLADKLGLVQSYADASLEYYYDDGVFFIVNSNGQYQVIVPPAGALVSELPDDYDVITIDGVDYYKVDDTIYHLTVVDGSPYLEVLGQLTGTLRDKYNFYK